MTDAGRGPSQGRVLIAEDDPAVRDSLEMALEYSGYQVVVANDGAGALKAAVEDEPDVIVLDVMMPVIDGLSVCRTLRQQGNRTPILVLTARAGVADRVEGLDAGADDYLTKPFALDELLARLRALMRRTSVAGDLATRELADLVLDTRDRTVRRDGEPIDLTKTEFDLLELLLANAGVVLTRETIYERIWGYDFETTSRSLDVYVSYLRRKTEEGGRPRLIHTVRGVGFTAREP